MLLKSTVHNCEMPRLRRSSSNGRVILSRSTKLPEQECNLIKDQYLGIYRDVLTFEERMIHSLSAQEFGAVWNLVQPAFNFLTGIQRCLDGPPSMPSRPPEMTHAVYHWAEEWYFLGAPAERLRRYYPDLCFEAFLEDERKHGRQNRYFEKLCAVRR